MDSLNRQLLKVRASGYSKEVLERVEEWALPLLVKEVEEEVYQAISLAVLDAGVEPLLLKRVVGMAAAILRDFVEEGVDWSRVTPFREIEWNGVPERAMCMALDNLVGTCLDGYSARYEIEDGRLTAVFTPDDDEEGGKEERVFLYSFFDKAEEEAVIRTLVRTRRLPLRDAAAFLQGREVPSSL